MMRLILMFVCGKTPYPLLVVAILFWPLASLVAQDLDSIGTAPPLTLYGSVGASLIGYSADGIDERREPLSWTVNGALNASIYEIDIPIDFILSEQEREFRQPFNRVGLSPSYKWARIHLGYRALNFSDYTLGGTTFLGGGVELTPGPLRIVGMYGRFQRAVEEDTTQEFVLPAYERWGYGGKIAYEGGGSDIGLIWFRAWDDSSSLSRQPTTVDIRPQENTVIGSTLEFDIVPNHFRFESEGAASILTRDIRSAPSDTTDIPSIANDIQTVRNSTTLTLAAKLGLRYTSNDFSARLGYERIEPEYESLGAYYFTTDVERFTLEPSFNLFEQRLRVSGSVGLERDNILETKLAQTNRVIGSALVGWDPGQTFGIDASYLNYSTGQVAGREPINDTIAVRNVSQSASLAPRLLFVGEKTNHFITVVGNLQDYTDKNAFTGELADSRSLTGNLIYNLAFVQTPLSTGASLLYSETTTGEVLTTSVGGSVNGSAGLFGSSLSLGASVGYTRTTQQFNTVETSADVLNENLNASYRLSDADLLTFTLYATQSSGNLSLNSDFNELTGVLSYSRSFSLRVGDKEEETP
ncbi:MAG: hypothetical protein KDD67_03705 [Ignavibacteriae bacterium]|nr:hypothetical protein [Ignavibacteriota bacterium]MCB9215053.1 hypothetical protein [Ignavibacteria bacterium]